MRERRKISAVYSDFISELRRLSSLDADNQERLLYSTGRDNPKLTQKQLYILSEGVFLSAFRAYENFIENMFLLYTLGRASQNLVRATPYIKPKNFLHARELIQSSMNHLDWSSPDEIIRRSEKYLKNGFPIKDPIASSRVVLSEMKKIRNHIAHNSWESAEQYKSVLRARLGTVPPSLPPPGEFLLLINRNERPKYFLLTYIDSLKAVASNMV